MENEGTVIKPDDRRLFIKKATGIALLSTIGLGLLGSCSKEEDDDKKVSPPEDLMQEHGLLNRILLIYDKCLEMIETKTEFDVMLIHRAAMILRTFIEDYHEKQEENYLFPRFRKANVLVDMVDTLKAQHDIGRNLTSRVLQLTGSGKMDESAKLDLHSQLKQFIKMYRPHEAREDTELFPAFRKIVSRHEYDSLGEDFEKNEHKLFGEDGFEKVLAKVKEIEASIIPEK